MRVAAAAPQTRGVRTPVLVVGAGPVGATLALELAHHRVRSMLIDRTTAAPAHPRMGHVTGRNMELLRRLGLAERIRARGIGAEHPADVAWSQGLHRPPVLVWHRPSVAELRRDYAAAADGSAPLEPYQRLRGSGLEGLLREAARAHPLIDVREGWTLVDLATTADGVTATVVDGRAGRRHVVAADYLAGCDGALSGVRRCLDVPVDEAGPRTQVCSVHFSSADPALRRHGRAFATVLDGGLTLLSRDEADEWTASGPVPADEPVLADPLRMVRDRLGVELAVDRLHGVAQWEAACAVAGTYRRGRAFLVGDAAHQFHAAGGHGANTGLGDAVDLGWKLAGAVAGWGGPRLLDSYELERRPVALLHRELIAGFLEAWQHFHRLSRAGAPREQLAGVLARQAHHVDDLGVHFGHRYPGSPVICAEPGEAPAWHWDRITPTTWPGGRAPALRLAGGPALFDLLGAGFTLVDLAGDGTGETMVKQARTRGVPMRHLVIGDARARACWERDLVLVRPDQHVAWRGHGGGDWDDVLDRVTGRADPVNA
jgi:2-polyprenyl-6-methoxyphenol hydroxylase-like FAD-dependent oxidoreductase